MRLTTALFLVPFLLSAPARSEAQVDSWFVAGPLTVYEHRDAWAEIGREKIFLPADEQSAILQLEKVPFKELDAA